MGAFGSISLANKFGIVLGCLVFLAFGAGLVKLWINKRRLRKLVKLADEESAKSQRPQATKKRDDDPRYLFGVRAIERGYFGGVAQTRSISSLGSLADNNSSNTSLPNRANDPKGTVPHSVLSAAAAEKQIRRKPTPLRLHPIELSFDEKSSPGVLDVEHAHMASKTSSTAQKNLKNASTLESVEADVSEKRVSKALPGVPPTDRPTSYLPRFDFPEPLRENMESNMWLPTPSNSVRSKKSKKGTVAGVSLPKVVEQPVFTAKSPLPYSAFPAVPIPPKSKLRSQRTIFPQEDRERVHSRRPSNFVLSALPTSSTLSTPKDISQSSATGHISGESVGSMTQYASKRKSSDAISLAALTGTPIKSSFPMPPPSPPDSEKEGEVLSSRGRATSTNSHTHHRKSSSSLSRTRNSIYRPRSTSASKRRSVQRDVLHYDPRSNHRDRSGSIQGRPVDFSQPRESPFSDLAAISSKGHTPSSSNGSDNSIITYYTTARPESRNRASLKTNSHLVNKVSDASSSETSSSMDRDGSRLRFTLDNFGTKNLAVPPPSNTTGISVRDNTPRISVINSKLTSQLEEEGKLQRSGTLSVAKVERRKPQRVSSNGGEWDILKPKMVSLETPSTSTSPVVASPGLGGERFPKIVR